MVLACGGATRPRNAWLCSDACGAWLFQGKSPHVEGIDCVVAGTGYTVSPRCRDRSAQRRGARSVGTAVTGAGVTPAGLGACYTFALRLGLPLHATIGRWHHLQAGLGWVVAWSRDVFVVARRSPPNKLQVSADVPRGSSPRDGRSTRLALCGAHRRLPGSDDEATSRRRQHIALDSCHPDRAGLNS